jgi:serine/threonine protein kinase HipA of HipAB toxin-antitoxin module
MSWRRGEKARAEPKFARFYRPANTAWPVIGDGPNTFEWHKVSMAMTLRAENAHYRMGEIQRRHWNAVAKANAIGSGFEQVIDTFIRFVPRNPALQGGE